LTKDSLALEVGSWKGRSSFVIANVCKEKGARLICIDTFIGSELNEFHYKEALDMGASKFMDQYIRKYLAGLPVEYIVENSLLAHKHIKNDSVVFCFIDGNHCAPVIGQDLDNYWPKVKRGGIFSGHDYSHINPDIPIAVDLKFPDSSKIKFYGSIWAVTKE
jgi:predicted O-methyltransferase YrrM